MDLRHLRHALALAEHRNFARAAESLRVTQSALSRSIQALEASVGVRLFDRSARDVEPTLFGRLLLDHARRLDLAARDLERELRLAQGLESGDLNVGAGPFGGAMMVGTVVGRLVQQHPKLRTNVVIGPWGEMPDRLRSRDIDLMVAHLHALDGGEEFESLELLPHPMYFVARPDHPLASLDAPTLADALRYPLVHTPPLHGAAHELLDDAPRELREALHRRGALTVTCDSTPVLKSIVRNSDALTALSPFMIADELHANTLCVLPGIDMGRPIRFSVVWLRGRTLSPPAQAFLDMVVDHDRELVEFERSLAVSPPNPA